MVDRPVEGGEFAAPAVGSAVTSLGTFTVNLRGGGGGRVLRIEVQVEGPTAQAETVAAKTAQIRDSIITAVSDYTWGELEGAGGKTRLRDELLARVNGAASPSQIERIYFTQFVVQ
jgi:flagellar basal body-associated protein FliL